MEHTTAKTAKKLMSLVLVLGLAFGMAQTAFAADQELRTKGFENSNTILDVELAARYDSEVVNPDGGSTEIVVFNSDNNCAYAINGTTGDLVKINMDGLSESGLYVDTLTGVLIPVKEIMATNSPDFAYGDMTSVAVSTQANVIAVALQSSDYAATGKLVLLTYDGAYIADFDTGVQPDMVTFTADGLTALTANEGEPREGTEGTDPKGSVTLVNLDTADLAASAVATVDFTDFDSQRQALVDASVVLLKDTLPSTDLEPEYIAVSGNMAYVSLQEANAIAVLDLEAKAFTGVYPLGFQNFGETALDLIKDSEINITTQPNVYGIKMPDGISAYTSGDTTYLLTANEGDSRSDWTGLDNEVKGTASPTGNVTTAEEVVWFNATQYDGLDESKAYVFGGRSFSIYEVGKDGLTLVYDSSSDFEEVTATYLADYFNCSNDKITLDNRSGKKGVEPENVTVGKIDGTTYAFIGLERIGGVMIYNISDPAEASYVNYINSRDFSDKIVGDVSPEGLFFSTVNGIPTLMSANEVSGTICAFVLTNDSDDEDESKASGLHELITLLTNPADVTGVRTMDLNYYLNDPVIWQSDVKNITIWLESEMVDLATANQTVMLPAGQTLLKDYNIRLMMKIVYNDGTVETRQVDNAFVARNIPVLIPIDEFEGTADLGIVYIADSGNTAVLPVTPVIIDGQNYLQFENNHFSHYGVVSGSAQAAMQQMYSIQPGDTLGSIAAKFGVTVQSLVAANNIPEMDLIYAGKVLHIA